MKQLKIFFQMNIIIVLSMILSACCREGGNETGVTSRNGIHFVIDSRFYIQKIELEGTGRLLECPISSGYTFSGYYSMRVCPEIKLNSKDTVGHFRIFYGDNYHPDSTIKSGTITMSYTVKPKYIKSGCYDNDLILEYDAIVSATTFAKVEIKYYSSDNEANEVQITP